MTSVFQDSFKAMEYWILMLLCILMISGLHTTCDITSVKKLVSISLLKCSHLSFISINLDNILYFSTDCFSITACPFRGLAFMQCSRTMAFCLLKLQRGIIYNSMASLSNKLLNCGFRFSPTDCL